jgi:hypothetical protein
MIRHKLLTFTPTLALNMTAWQNWMRHAGLQQNSSSTEEIELILDNNYTTHDKYNHDTDKDEDDLTEQPLIPTSQAPKWLLPGVGGRGGWLIGQTKWVPMTISQIKHLMMTR